MLSVSVVIPAYNAAEYITDALESVEAQTYPSDRLEVIVVDDGSEDETASVSRNYLAGMQVRSQVLKIENGGPSRARNVGWQTASGDWIQFLDDDDRIATSKIETQARAAATTSAEVAVVYSAWQRMHSSGDDGWTGGEIARPRVSDESPLLDLLAADNFIATGSQLFRRSWLDAVNGFDERYRVIEDVHLLLRIAMAGARFYHVPSKDPLFFYRQREGSLSRHSRTAFANGCMRNARLVEEHWRSTNSLTYDRIQFLTRVYFFVTRELALCDWEGCISVWRHIQELNPGAIPPKPASLRILSRVIGFPAAQSILSRVQQVRKRLRSTLSVG
jgi:glycosyltransferase involved in cell wall biosynthesis